MVEAYEKNKDAAQTASNFSVSVTLKGNERGCKPLLSEEDHKRIRAKIEAQNDITIEEIREHLKIAASYSTVERTVRKMGYTLKKKTLHASERDLLRCGCRPGARVFFKQDLTTLKAIIFYKKPAYVRQKIDK